jgi:hypothetical protein
VVVLPYRADSTVLKYKSKVRIENMLRYLFDSSVQGASELEENRGGRKSRPKVPELSDRWAVRIGREREES